ncbi:hypothetical protein LMG33818_002201 [Halomonadaceae bacterium LMG 33818]|uniref:hypothetical protein n=1 Tax=Cernens ardua TaxID=3402176 RepID=UPI003EDBBD4E
MSKLKVHKEGKVVANTMGMMSHTVISGISGVSIIENAVPTVVTTTVVGSLAIHV